MDLIKTLTVKDSPAERRGIAIERVMRVFGLLPSGLARKLEILMSSREDFPHGLSEIRLRVGGSSHIVLSGKNIQLSSGINSIQAEEIMTKLCHGSRYAFEDSIKEGYITVEGGIRVGIVAEARYAGGSIVGVGNIYGFVFRIPTADSQVSSELADMFFEQTQAGMLIFSPPGVGKTSALRAVAKILGSAPYSKRVVIVDERCEFCRDDYRSCCVDVIGGYKKREGIELALRSLSPEVLIVDELIGEAEAKALISAGRGGVSLFASIHASDANELLAKDYIKELFSSGVFDTIAGIYVENGKRILKKYRFNELREVLPC